MAKIDGFPDKIPLGATDDINGDAAAVGTVDGEEAGTEEPTLERLLEGATDSTTSFENGVAEGVALLSTAANDDVDGIDEAAETLLGASLGKNMTTDGRSDGTTLGANMIGT